MDGDKKNPEAVKSRRMVEQGKDVGKELGRWLKIQMVDEGNTVYITNTVNESFAFYRRMCFKIREH